MIRNTNFDWLFDNRQKVDYRPLVTFEQEEVQEILEQSRAFLGEMERLAFTAEEDCSPLTGLPDGTGI